MPIAPCYCNNEVANSNEVARNNEVAMREVKTLGLLGTGVIGGGWAARALHFGIDVVAADVKPEMEAWIRGAIENAEPALARLTLAPLQRKGTLSFNTDLRISSRRTSRSNSNSNSGCSRR